MMHAEMEINCNGPKPDVVPQLPKPELGQPVEKRIEVEMEKINKAISEVNRRNGDYYRVKQQFRRAIEEAKQKLDRVYRAHRKAIERANPYWAAKAAAEKLRADHKVVLDKFEQALMEFEDAQENQQVAEKVLCEGGGFLGDQGGAILENLNKATTKVHEASQRKNSAQKDEQLKRKELEFAEDQLTMCEKDLKKPIEKSWAYYTMRSTCEKQLERESLGVRISADHVSLAKDAYTAAFQRLEVLTREVEQRTTAWDFRSSITGVPNLSKFEELDEDCDDIAVNFDAVEALRPPMVRTHSVDSLTDIEKDLGELSADERAIAKSISLMELSISVPESVEEVDEEEELENG